MSKTDANQQNIVAATTSKQPTSNSGLNFDAPKLSGNYYLNWKSVPMKLSSVNRTFSRSSLPERRSLWISLANWNLRSNDSGVILWPLGILQNLLLSSTATSWINPWEHGIFWLFKLDSIARVEKSWFKRNSISSRSFFGLPVRLVESLPCSMKFCHFNLNEL